jgi:hypothetical protein
MPQTCTSRAISSWPPTALWPNLLTEQSWPLSIFAGFSALWGSLRSYLAGSILARFDPAKDSTKSGKPLGSFCRASCEAKAYGAPLYKMPREEPHKKNVLQMFKLGLLNSSLLVSAIFARPYYDWNILDKIWIKYFKYDLTGQKSPKQGGRNLGVWVWTFAGQFLLRGSSFSPSRSLAKKNQAV